jgi:ABC-type multidrug transport system ATPase subunit
VIEAHDRSAPRFQMQGIVKRFDATVALAGVDLAVAPGEVCGLVGENGAGKSTLMAILSGALAPDDGTMTLEGRTYAPRDPMAARRAGIASAIFLSPSSSWSRLRGRSRSAAACSCSTNRRAHSAEPTSSACSPSSPG